MRTKFTTGRGTFGVLVGTAVLLAGMGAAGAHAATAAGKPAKAVGNQASCHLVNGIKHVVELTFDNVHYYRDNPNVPSDLEMLPNLLHFIEGNGTLLTNNHTPLIAHTANDILTTYTGIYGDRHGMPISNSYNAFNKDGTTDHAGSFAYWTDPIFDETSPANRGADTRPSMVYSPVPPATAKTPVKPNTTAPAPWVPFTRAGCDVGEIANANTVLENAGVDLPQVFGVNSQEMAQYRADKDSFKDAETADYVGLAVHCSSGAAFCGNAMGIKYGQTFPSPTAVNDILPNEPGGYIGYQGLFGHRYVAPQLGAGKPNVTHNGYQVTNSKGNLVDLNGNELDGAFLNNYPGFPGFDLTAPQSLAYTADMLESGVQVVNTYMADIHGNQNIPALSKDCANAPSALGSGSACYVAQAQYYNQAFGVFLKRLAADGITSKNTLFIVSSDEGDHQAGANVGRALTPSPATCDGAKVSGNTVTPDVLCTYGSGTFGELSGNLTGLLATQKKNTTPFSLENDTAPEFYVTGNPAATDPKVRQLERDAASVTNVNPYTGKSQAIANYMADPTEQAILHMVNADPNRTPTFAMFAKPDYYLTAGSATCPPTGCVSQTDSFAWDHGAYAAEINTSFVAWVGPGVAQLGLDGNQPQDGPGSSGANSGQVTVSQLHLRGPWTDETDIRPTLMYLTGLKDDYIQDGRVISQVLADPGQLGSHSITELGACYKQLNSSVGYFGAATLIADTKAVKSNTPGDQMFIKTDAALRALEVARDALAIQIKDELYKAEFSGAGISNAWQLTAACTKIIMQANQLAGGH